MLNYHQSDIFNVHDKSFQAQKKPKTSKIGVNPQISTCFD
jgi:hypothetical protein